MPASPIDDVLDLIPALARKERRVAALPGGLTNTNYKVDVGGRSYVVRVSAKDSSLLAIDREHEHHASVAAAETGVGARSSTTCRSARSSCSSSSRGRRRARPTCAEATGSTGSPTPVAACTQGGASSATSTCSRSRRATGGSSASAASGCPERYDEFAPLVAEIRDALAVRDEGTVPCNNDLLAENFIDVGDRFRLIDYEYAGNNDACFELGNIWSESNLSLAQLDELVTHYYGQRLRHKIARARLLGLMSKYGWTLWASIQDGVSEIDFDFWSWGMEKYERAVAEFDGPDLPRLLEEARRED